MSTDNHDKMIEAFQSYFKWQDRFEFHDSDEAGIKVPQKKKLNSGTTRWMKDFIWYLSVAIGASFFLVLANYAFAGGNTTTIKYQGQPVPSAMAPSMSAFSQDVCAVPVSGGANTGVFAISGGTVMTDDNCVRLKNAKALHDMGLKVAAVSLLCKNPDVWDAMEMSGSPCPVMGSVGDAAREGWWQLDKGRFKKLYGSNYELKTKKQVKVDEEVITQPYNPDTN